jgi:preprotein translocase SecE subunit
MAKEKITRIKANDSKSSEDKSEEPTITRKKVVIKDKKESKAEKKALKAEKKAEKAKAREGKKAFILFRPFCAFGRYLRDSWRELRQVRWPNRKATWKMVLAVVIYTAIFVVIIVLLDMLFSFIFKQILG